MICPICKSKECEKKRDPDTGGFFYGKTCGEYNCRLAWNQSKAKAMAIGRDRRNAQLIKK